MVPIFFHKKKQKLLEVKFRYFWEIMVLQGDIRYINRKYIYTSAIFNNQYYHFYRKGSILGDWIASHKVLTSVNKNLFVHAGVSDPTLGLQLSLKEINNTFTKKIT
mgnify:FL=1